jgi:hypothetical protein
MPTLRSFAELAGFRPREPLHVVNLRLARAIASLSPRYQERSESDESARLERRPVSRLGGGVCEDTLRMALRPVHERQEPALVGRDYDPRLDVWTKRVPPAREPGRPPATYMPVSLAEGRLWWIVDRITRENLWQVRGPFTQARREATKAARSQGCDPKDVFLREVCDE